MASYGRPDPLGAQAAPTAGQALLRHLNKPWDPQAVAWLGPCRPPKLGSPEQASPHPCDGLRHPAPAAPAASSQLCSQSLAVAPHVLPVPFVLSNFIPFPSHWAQGRPGSSGSAKGGYLKRGGLPRSRGLQGISIWDAVGRVLRGIGSYLLLPTVDQAAPPRHQPAGLLCWHLQGGRQHRQCDGGHLAGASLPLSRAGRQLDPAGILPSLSGWHRAGRGWQGPVGQLGHGRQCLLGHLR